MIKTFLSGLGFLFLLAFFAAVFVFGRWQSLDDTSRKFAAQSIATVFTNVDYDELKRRSDPQMFAGKTEAEDKAVFAKFSQLGKLQSIDSCEGQALTSLTSTKHEISARYDCKVKFEQDTAIITLVLLGNDKAILLGNYGNSWRIVRLNVNSDYLIKKKTPAK